MSFFNAVFVYFLIWWLTLFTVLPLGVERHGEDGKGHDAGAPRIPDLRRKLILNSLISLLILAIVYMLAETGMIDWKGIFQGEL